MMKKYLDKIMVFVKWVLMWTCDVIPGVSWWTIAFITWIYDKLIDSGIYNYIDARQTPAYSAVWAFNMQGILDAILQSIDGWVFAGTVAEDVIAKWSEKKETNQ